MQPTTIRKKSWVQKLLIVGAVLLVVATIVAAGVWRLYNENLKAVSTDTKTVQVVIENGESPATIAQDLYSKSLIRNERFFVMYSWLNNASRYLQAGTYNLSPSQSTQQIVSQLTNGKVATELITILPGQRLDQIRTSLIQDGFSESEVDAALEPTQYENLSVLADKPKGANLEGYLYPDSYQRSGGTKASVIIQQAIARMGQELTPAVVAGFKQQGISTYEGIILASIVEKEVVTESDRRQAAQVFVKRIKIGMPLGSDVTAFYGSELAGAGQDVTYDTPYNTRIRDGMPPTPISNVSKSSLEAVSSPATTDWLFFVAGDDGTTYFSKTVEEHEALTAKYCIKLCQ
jgi:UPF0755 protein